MLKKEMSKFLNYFYFLKLPFMSTEIVLFFLPFSYLQFIPSMMGSHPWKRLIAHLSASFSCLALLLGVNSCRIISVTLVYVLVTFILLSYGIINKLMEERAY